MGKNFNIGLVRVVTIADEGLLNLHGRLIEKYFPGMLVESRCIPDQPEGIHDSTTELQAVPKIKELAESWRDIDALVVSCAGDPAVAELRSKLSIPVIGAGESTAFFAAKYGRKVGVLGITEEVPGAYRKTFGSNIVGTCKPEGINSTLDLMTDVGRKKVIQKAQELKVLGAEVIALACTGMSTIGIAAELEEVLHIPVIDPVMAEGLMAYFECLRRMQR